MITSALRVAALASAVILSACGATAADESVPDPSPAVYEQDVELRPLGPSLTCPHRSNEASECPPPQPLS